MSAARIARVFPCIASAIPLSLGGPKASASVLAVQDFDGGSPGWTYTLDHLPVTDAREAFVFEPVAGFGSIAVGRGQFLGTRSVAEFESAPGAGVTARFSAVPVAGFTGLVLSFDYMGIAFDAGESIAYELVIDGVPQGSVPLLTGRDDVRVNVTGTETRSIAATETVALHLTVSQTGFGDYAGFDNVQLTGRASVVPEPAGVIGLGFLLGLAHRRKRNETTKRCG